LNKYITPEHLDIPIQITQELIEECTIGLEQMNFYKTPRNKLLCISNCCRIIFKYLENNTEKSPSVDDFLPVLTYIIIKTATPNILSNINFITNFRDESDLLSSSGFFFTNMMVAIDYTRNLDESQLISQYENNIKMKENKKKYKFLDSKHDQLSPKDVEELLEEYKRLVEVEIEYHNQNNKF